MNSDYSVQLEEAQGESLSYVFGNCDEMIINNCTEYGVKSLQFCLLYFITYFLYKYYISTPEFGLIQLF